MAVIEAAVIPEKHERKEHDVLKANARTYALELAYARAQKLYED